MLDEHTFDWTSLGDSYATGVGAGNYVNGMQCLRYDQAYPPQLDKEDLSPEKHGFSNNACSGETTKHVELFQLEDWPTEGVPEPTYGYRPGFGFPQFATLTVGGDDIDFPGILLNCILETSQALGEPSKSCDQQRQETWDLLNDKTFLVPRLDRLIKLIVAKGHLHHVGDLFKLYVTGYAEFSNEDDPGCDNVTFARTANPTPDGKQHTLLTTELRKEYNKMSRALNAQILEAVYLNRGTGVTFIDIQSNGVLDGHRFCENGVKEPDQQNPNLWFYHYPYRDPPPQDAKAQILADAYQKAVQGLNSSSEINAKYPNSSALIRAVYAAIDLAKLNEINPGDPNNEAFWGGQIGWRAKVFHPPVAFHTHIKNLIFAQYKQDIQNYSVPLPNST